MVRFSETTELPATLVLSESLILISKTQGVVGLGKGQQIKVTARSNQKLTVMSDGNAFTVDAKELANAIVVPDP